MFGFLLNLQVFFVLVLFGLCLCFLACWIVFRYQDKAIYVPSIGSMIPRSMAYNEHGFRYPSDRELRYIDVRIKRPDGVGLHGWLIFLRSTPHTPSVKKSKKSNVKIININPSKALLNPNVVNKASPLSSVNQSDASSVNEGGNIESGAEIDEPLYKPKTRITSLSRSISPGKLPRLEPAFLKMERFNAPTVIFFHENTGNIGMRLGYLDEYVSEVDCNILIVAYRGYSLSQGTPSEAAIKADSLALLDWVFEQQREFDSARILLHGRSLGAAVMLYALANSRHRDKIRAFIAESSFTSMNELVATLFPKLSWFRKLLLRNYWNSLFEIRQLPGDQSALFITGEKDELTPTKMMQILFENYKGTSKTLLKIQDGDHNEPWKFNRRMYWSYIRKMVLF